MSAKKIVLVVIALVSGLGTMQLARTLLQQEPPKVVVQAPKKQEPKTRVLVAAADLPAGTLIKPDKLQWKEWSKDDGRLASFIVQGDRKIADFRGAVVRRGIMLGEPIVDGRLVRPGEQGFLAVVLERGMRAVSVPINGVTGIAGLVFPGDRVDLILTHSFVRQGDETMPERRASETVLSNVRVLAIDQTTNDQTTAPRVGQIATLEVTRKQAEMVMLMVEIGQLSLSLRSLEPAGDDKRVAAAAEARAEELVQLHGATEAQKAGAMDTGTKTVGVDVAETPGDPAMVQETRPPQVARIPSPYVDGTTRSFSWDSDVSHLLPEPKDREGPRHRVQILRGAATTEQTFN